MRRLALILLLGAGCSHVHSVHQDALEPTPGVAIDVVAEKRVWFNFNFDNDFIEEARARFVAKCPGGTIHSVSSRLSSENGVFYWDSRVRFAGICVPPNPGEVASADATPAPGSQPRGVQGVGR